MKKRVVEKPWGFEHIWAETEDYVAKMLHINPKQRLSLQYHVTKEETVYVLEGTLLNWTDADGAPEKYPAGATYHVEPNQVHRFGVVRLADDYER
jgi:quercetin dioxygenase-like cupin family protein